LGGYLFDKMGSYAWPLAVCLLCFAISGLAIHACTRWHAREIGRAG